MSFKIEEWQVMQAWKNGASIESTSRIHPKWVLTTEPLWNWEDNDYRIANLTGDYIRLDQLVEAYPEKIVVVTNLCTTHELLCCNAEGVQIETLISFLCESPECIAQIEVKKTEKKLRPWTMEEFEKHREEWFVSLAGKNHKALFYDHRCILLAKYHEPELTYIEFMERFTREDGSPCGVLE